MRDCPPTTAALLANPPPGLKSADLFAFTLANGQSYYWTSYDRDLPGPGSVTWRYQILPSGTSTDYSSPTYDDSAWPIGYAPFGTDFCPLPPFPSGTDYSQTPATVIPQQIVLWARGEFDVDTIPSSFTFDAIIDNYSTVWINGTQVVAEAPPPALSIHHLQASISPSVLVVGKNQIAVKVVDDGMGVRPGNFEWFDTHMQTLVTYRSRAPWLKRSKWSVTNTMQVPTLSVYLFGLDDGFAGGADIKAQITNGLFDGAQMTLTRVFFMSADAPLLDPGILLFGGPVANIEPQGSGFVINVKGKSNLLNQYAPRNLYQLGCEHAFCDAGCTLLRSSFTTAYTVGSSPTRTFIPWSGSPPGNASHYRYGTVTFTSGPCAGQKRTVRAADSTGLTLVHPLIGTPVAGDAFTAFEGCDKALNSGSGQDCTARSNTQNWRAFPFVPPADTAF